MSRSVATLGAAAAILAIGVLAGPGVKTGEASNHVDSPTQILDPQMDVTDLYAFTSPDRPDTVTVIWNYIPFEAPVVPLPWYRFATRGYYDLHIDRDGDAREDLTYRWWYRNGDGSGDPKAPPSKGYPNFSAEGEADYPSDEPTTGGYRSKRTLIQQSYKLELLQPGKPTQVLLEDAPVSPWPLGGDYKQKFEQAIVPLPNGGKTFSGPVKDPFFFDLRSVSLTRIGNPAAPPFDFFAPFNVHTIAIQLPKKELAINGDVARNPVTGIWATSSRETVSLDRNKPAYQQVSRQGLSMFGDSVNPHLLRDAYHRAHPSSDAANKLMLKGIQYPYASALLAPGLLHIPPPGPRRDFEQVFLHGISKATGPIKIDLNAHQLNKDADPSRIVPAEMTRLNMAIPVTAKPNRFGVIGGDLQGWPNGRRLTDDVTVSFMRMAMGEPMTRGTLLPTWFSPVTGPAKAIRPVFPYEAYPDIR